MKRFFVIGGMIFLLGCATIVNTTTQKVPLNTTPDGAKVFMKGVHVGTTPAVLQLSRGDADFILRFEKDGYDPIDVTLTKNVSGVIIGNVLLGGVIGLVIDFVDGAAYTLSPGELNIIMQKQEIKKTALPQDSVIAIDMETLKELRSEAVAPENK